MKRTILIVALVLTTICSNAQVRPSITSFTSAQLTTLANLMQQYITPQIIQQHCDYNAQTGDPLVNIHDDFDFLPFHRMYLEGMEDFLIQQGYPEFVPLPYWNAQLGCVPTELRVVDPDCTSGLTCGNTTSTNVSLPTNWCPTNNRPADISLPVVAGGSNDLCDWVMNPTTPPTAIGICPTCTNCCPSGLSRKIENPYHDDGHITLGGVMGNFRSPGTPVFWLWHAYIDDIWKEWEEFCPSSTTAAVDFYMKDNHKVMQHGRDRGEEPNIDNGAPYLSNDIWVRQNDDGLTNHTHQNPEFISGIPVYVYVRVRNRGYTPSSGINNGSEQLKLYWAKASTGLGWPAHWNGSLMLGPGAPAGNIIDAKNIDVIDAGDQKIYKFEWYPENPDNYVGINMEPWHFCLLARVDAPTTDPMTFTETTDLGANVVNNNNIVWKNISVYNAIPGIVQGGDDCLEVMEDIGVAVAVANPDKETNTYDIVFEDMNHIHCEHHDCMVEAMAHDFDTPEGEHQHVHVPIADRGNTITEEGTVTVALDDKLYKNWVKGGKKGEGFIELKTVSIPEKADENKQQNLHSPLVATDRHLFQITAKHATFANITLQGLELNTTSLVVLFPTTPVSDKQRYDYNINQYETATGRLVGGVQYDIYKPKCGGQAANAGTDRTINKGCKTTLTDLNATKCTSFAWFDGNGNVISENPNLEVSPTVTTTYMLKTVTPYGCVSEDKVTVNVLNKPCLKKGEIIKFSPNPATDRVTTEFAVVRESKEIVFRFVKNDNTYEEQYKFDGKLEEKAPTGTKTDSNYLYGKFELDISKFPKGSYRVNIYVDGENADSKQLIIQ